jgi:hypothetical protein
VARDQRDDIPPIPAPPVALAPVEPLPAVPAPIAPKASDTPTASDTPPPPYQPVPPAPPAPPTPPAYPIPYDPAIPLSAYASTQPSRGQGLSIAALICGIASFAFGPLASVVAIITGHLASQREPHSRGMWLTGLILGYVGLGLFVLFIGFYVLLVATVAQYSGGSY